MCKRYGYARVSTETQRLDRQIKNIQDYAGDLRIEKIYKEKFTGTKLGRPEFQKLLKVIQSGDTVIFDSVSRMSRTADEGYNLYMDLMNRGINLVFIKEPHINTDYYKRMTAVAETNIATTGKQSTDKLIKSIMDAVNEFQREETKEKIRVAFWQAEKEVMDLHKRISEGIKTTQENNKSLPPEEQKQIGRMAGRKYETKKSVELKKKILRQSKDFDGNLLDKEVIENLGIATNTYYKYKRELRLMA